MVQIPPKPYESSASPCSLRGPRAMSAGGRQCLGHGFPPHQLLSAILPVSASVGENWRLYLGLSSVTEALCADVAVDLGDKITQARRDRGDGRKGPNVYSPSLMYINYGIAILSPGLVTPQTQGTLDGGWLGAAERHPAGYVL